jgi:hypothetical protein
MKGIREVREIRERESSSLENFAKKGGNLL